MAGTPDISHLSKSDQQKLLELFEVQHRRRADKSFIEFCKQVEIPGVPIPDVQDGELFPYNNTPAEHHELICKALQDAVDGAGPKNVMIFCPPGTAKSSYGSVAFPSWFMGRYPDKNVIATTYNSSFAQKNARKVRALCSSGLFKEIFDTELNKENSAVLDWSLLNGATYMGGGVMSGITGNRADCIPDGTLIKTDKGDVKIEEIVDNPSGYKVLSYNHSLDKVQIKCIIATKTSQNEELYEIRTTKGYTFRCTGGHKVFTEGAGYIKASDLTQDHRLLYTDWEEGVSGESSLQCLWRRVSAPILRVPKIIKEICNRSVLFKKLLHKRSCNEVYKEVRSLRGKLCEKERASVLFGRLQRGCQFAEKGGEKAVCKLLTVYKIIRGGLTFQTILQQKLRRQVTLNTNEREYKFEGYKQNSIYNGVVSGNTPIDKKKGWKPMFPLWSDQRGRGKKRPSCSSYRREHVEQLNNKPYNIMYSLSQEGSLSDIREGYDAIKSIKRISCEPHKVHDIQVEDNHNFFANGILVHNCLIVDDPLKTREQAESKIIREKLWDEWVDSLLTRMKPNGVKIIIMTRWHEDDLAGRILPKSWSGESGVVRDREDSEDWNVICLPAQCDREDDPLGRKVGEFLWSSWFNDWEKRKAQAGDRSWNALYQQKPVADSGNILRKEWWQKWPQSSPPSCEMIIQSYDTAFTEKDSADYTARTTWGLFKYTARGFERYGLILLDRLEVKIDFPKLRDEVISSAEKYKPDLILIENKGSGMSLGQELTKITQLPIKMIDVKLDKITRASLASSYLEGGAVWYMDKPFAQDVIENCASFPYGSHDDLADTCTQAWNWCRKKYILGVEMDEDELPERPKPPRRYYGSQ